jgi:pimeloyl-ACP methyl ester carboxylesterase
MLPGRSMSARNFWYYDPGTGITHAEQLVQQGVDVYLVDPLAFGNSVGDLRRDYTRIQFAEQIGVVIETMPEYESIACLGFCNTTVVPLVLLAQGLINRAVVMSPTIFDSTWCAEHPGVVRRWQRTQTATGFWTTSLDKLIEQQLNKISDSEIGQSQRVATWYNEMQRLTREYSSYQDGAWSASRTWWLDRINWPIKHQDHGFDTAALAGKPVLFTRGEYDVEVPESWFDRAVGYFANANVETYTIPGATHFALWEHGYQSAVDRVAKFLLA